MTTKELVDGCIAKKLDAQRYLFDTYSRRLLGIVTRYFNELEDAEDVLIEAFHLILTKMETYSGNEEERVFFAWMKRICINKALTKIRHDKVHHKECKMEDEYQYISCGTDIFDEIEEKEKAKYLLAFIHELPRQQRTVFNLYAVEGYTHKEIADELGISEGTSKSNYCRAKEKIQIKLEKRKNYEQVESN